MEATVLAVAFLSNISLAVFVFFDPSCKNHNAGASVISSQLHIPFIAFLYVNIKMLELLYQQLVKLVIYKCFRFFVYKNYNAGVVILAASMLAAVSSQLHVSVFAFFLVKIITRGQLC